MLIVRSIGGVDFGGTLTIQKRRQRLVQKGRIGQRGEGTAGIPQELLVNGRAYPNTSHALIVA